MRGLLLTLIVGNMVFAYFCLGMMVGALISGDYLIAGCLFVLSVGGWGMALNWRAEWRNYEKWHELKL